MMFVGETSGYVRRRLEGAEGSQLIGAIGVWSLEH
jgi:hypothetical protein